MDGIVKFYLFIFLSWEWNPTMSQETPNEETWDDFQKSNNKCIYRNAGPVIISLLLLMKINNCCYIDQQVKWQLSLSMYSIKRDKPAVHPPPCWFCPTLLVMSPPVLHHLMKKTLGLLKSLWSNNSFPPWAGIKQKCFSWSVTKTCNL